jgi:D-glycero-D-manno-heptose 1,7-bisphosphate phosphatase
VAERLLILDRDGVLNRMVAGTDGSLDSPMSTDQVRVFPWVPPALKRLQEGGYGLCIATNQPSAAKGKATRPALEEVHARILELAQADGARILSSHICWHLAEDGCACRKPKPGLLLEALVAHPRLAKGGAWMAGDRATDVQAGIAAGVRTAWLSAAPKEMLGGTEADYTGPDLDAFSHFLLSRPGSL